MLQLTGGRASSSAVEQRTHNPTGRRFESYLAYPLSSVTCRLHVTGSCAHRPFRETAAPVTLACFDAIAVPGVEQGLQFV